MMMMRRIVMKSDGAISLMMTPTGDDGRITAMTMRILMTMMM